MTTFEIQTHLDTVTVTVIFAINGDSELNGGVFIHVICLLSAFDDMRDI